MHEIMRSFEVFALPLALVICLLMELGCGHGTPPPMVPDSPEPIAGLDGGPDPAPTAPATPSPMAAPPMAH